MYIFSITIIVIFKGVRTINNNQTRLLHTSTYIGHTEDIHRTYRGHTNTY